MKSEFLTPVGRLVQGDPFEAQTKNMQGQPLMTQAGQPTRRYFIAVAFRKDDPAFAALWATIEGVGRGSFPQLNIANPWDPACRFSWKVVDGDGIDDNGKSNANKEGFAGHWIVKFSSSFAPKCFHAGHYAPHEQIQDPKAIHRGYFVRVAGTVEGNGNQQKPGVYVNLNMVELAGIGPEITSGPDASSVFGGAAPVLPAGASPLPMHAGGLPASQPINVAALPTPGLPVAGAPLFPPQVPGVASTVAPGLPIAAALPTSPALPQVPGVPMPVTPHTAILQGPQMTAKAGGFTREQYHAQGWTDDMLRAQGMMS